MTTKELGNAITNIQRRLSRVEKSISELLSNKQPNMKNDNLYKREYHPPTYHSPEN